MANQILVSPSLLSADFASLKNEIAAVVAAGADWIHIDVMDGHFVPNITIGAPVVASLRKITQAPLDVHLMIENPEKYVDDFANAGSDWITFHIEATRDPEALIKKIRALGPRVGVTLRPSTDVASLLPYLALVDMALVMTVNPGFSGQTFMSDQIEKIKRVRKEADRVNPKLLIQVDGGINATTGQLCYEAGARVFVAGHFIFKSDYKNAISQLKGMKHG